MPLSLTFDYYNFWIIASSDYLNIWLFENSDYQWLFENNGLLLLVILAWKYYISSYFNELSHSAVGQSAYVIMPSFAKLIAITFPLKK